MKLCLVFVVCMLAVIPATTALTQVEIRNKLRAIDNKPADIMSITFQKTNYKSSCDCVMIQGVDFSTNPVKAQIWQGSVCNTSNEYEGFECAVYQGTEKRWKPIDTCTTVDNCPENSNFECNGLFSIGTALKHCLKISTERTAVVNNVAFCPCDQSL